MKTSIVSQNVSRADYGFFDGEKYVQFTNATDLKGAVVIMVKRIMRMEENSPVFTDGVFDHKATLQNWINDYGLTVIENMVNDGYEASEMPSIVCADEVADHIINTYGWLTLNRTSIDHSIVYNELKELMNRWNMQDYAHK